jgi:hypothetical protein
MATFTSFANRLPDPNFGIAEDGSTSNNTIAGPGFASVRFSSEQPTAISRTNSGRVITRAIAAHKWKVSISYNPMTRDQFEPVYNFLLEKRGRLKPFFVALPQHASTRTTTSGTISVQGTITSGDSNFLIDGMNAANGELRPGDMINFADSTNSNHKKAYKIVRVHTSSNKLTGDSALNTTDERRLYVVPPVEKDVADNSTLTYNNPLIRVIQTADVQEYSLGTNNLYTFSLNLEEAQP